MRILLYIIEPDYAIIDLQSVKTTSLEEERGFDGGKNKRTQTVIGNLLSVLVARDAFAKYPTIQRFCADAWYRKTFEQDVARGFGIGVDISVRIKSEWEVWPKRWIVEHSFAWLNNSRRLYKDYEISLSSAQAICTIDASRTLLKRF